RFLIWDLEADGPIDQQWVNQMQADPAFALCLGVRGEPVMGELRAQIDRIKLWGGTFPIILVDACTESGGDKALIQYTKNLGPLIQGQYGDGMWLRPRLPKTKETSDPKAISFRNQTAF